MPGKTKDSSDFHGGAQRSFNEAPAKCRGKRPKDGASQFPSSSFNEAPAKCRGKHVAIHHFGQGGELASMRPQRNAGENRQAVPVQPVRRRASMRPQRNAGENRCPPLVERTDDVASMRPQRNAGENFAGTARKRESYWVASMRPQRNAGENVVAGLQPPRCDHASMRPQRNAGENEGIRRRFLCDPDGFNEAPAKCRGKLRLVGQVVSEVVRFNEAPAKCRGKLSTPCSVALHCNRLQ